MCDIVVNKFTFAILSPDEFLLHMRYDTYRPTRISLSSCNSSRKRMPTVRVVSTAIHNWKYRQEQQSVSSPQNKKNEDPKKWKIHTRPKHHNSNEHVNTYRPTECPQTVLMRARKKTCCEKNTFNVCRKWGLCNCWWQYENNVPIKDGMVAENWTKN